MSVVYNLTLYLYLVILYCIVLVRKHPALNVVVFIREKGTKIWVILYSAVILL